MCELRSNSARIRLDWTKALAARTTPSGIMPSGVIPSGIMPNRVTPCLAALKIEIDLEHDLSMDRLSQLYWKVVLREYLYRTVGNLILGVRNLI